jgi:hypothetical protein
MDGGGVRCWSDESGRTGGGADGGGIDTPSQSMSVAGLRGRFGVQKDGAHETVMAGQMVLREVIAQVFGSWAPVN